MSIKLNTPKNANYAATIICIRSIKVLENCDNVVGVPVFGYQAIVSKNTKIGDLGVLFSAETQLSRDYASKNNLYRDAALNADKSVTGYLEDNSRIRAIKFRGHRSDALIMPLSSLKFTGIDISELKENDTFDELNNISICQKYVIKNKRDDSKDNLSNKKIKQAFKRIDSKMLPEHYDTDNWFRNSSKVDDNEMLIITAKLHGTSKRQMFGLVRRKLPLKDKIAKFFGVKVAETEYDRVYGSRRVIKDANNPNQNSYYDDDIWTIAGKKLDNIIPKDHIIYSELIGWTPAGSAIQYDYTYNVPKDQIHEYIYRIAVMTGSGRLVELPWDAVKKFCKDNGINHVPELMRMTKKQAVESNIIEKLMDIKFYDNKNQFEFTDTPLPLSNPKLVDEGVCIRIDRDIPYILKAKSPEFLNHETKLLDKGTVDLESFESIAENEN